MVSNSQLKKVKKGSVFEAKKGAPKIEDDQYQELLDIISRKYSKTKKKDLEFRAAELGAEAAKLAKTRPKLAEKLYAINQQAWWNAKYLQPYLRESLVNIIDKAANVFKYAKDGKRREINSNKEFLEFMGKFGLADQLQKLQNNLPLDQEVIEKGRGKLDFEIEKRKPKGYIPFSQIDLERRFSNKNQEERKKILEILRYMPEEYKKDIVTQKRMLRVASKIENWDFSKVPPEQWAELKEYVDADVRALHDLKKIKIDLLKMDNDQIADFYRKMINASDVAISSFIPASCGHSFASGKHFSNIFSKYFKQINHLSKTDPARANKIIRMFTKVNLEKDTTKGLVDNICLYAEELYPDEAARKKFLEKTGLLKEIEKGAQGKGDTMDRGKIMNLAITTEIDFSKKRLKRILNELKDTIKDKSEREQFLKETDLKGEIERMKKGLSVHPGVIMNADNALFLRTPSFPDKREEADRWV